LPVEEDVVEEKPTAKHTPQSKTAGLWHSLSRCKSNYQSWNYRISASDSETRLLRMAPISARVHYEDHRCPCTRRQQGQQVAASPRYSHARSGTELLEAALADSDVCLLASAHTWLLLACLND
jgi:hypothetical protein